MLPVVKTPYCSVLCGELADGCKSCVEGGKLVLFVTGLCPATCFFCPISDEKKMKDVMFANETPLVGSEEEQVRAMIGEARANGAVGAGITGGDPLARLARTCTYIRALKREFGAGFHIHLYTPLILVNERTLKNLYDAGLDEIRFHPSLQSEKFWPKMELARAHPWKVGIEIPVFPDKEEASARLIAYACERKLIDFLNLNELEIAERTAEAFAARGYAVVSSSSHAVKGSKEVGMRLMEVARAHGVPVHFCTCKLKDRIQMGNRIIRRAANVARPFDSVDEEGLLTRGAIYLACAPGEGYAQRLAALTDAERAAGMARLEAILAWLRAKGMPADAGEIDAARLRIVLGSDALQAMGKRVMKAFPDARCATVKEYPTSDAFIVELSWLPTRT